MMKVKLLAIFAIAGMAIVGCGSNKNDDGTTDSAVVDTTMNSPAMDSTQVNTTMQSDTAMKPVDSAKR